jgi:hypothetical protein
LAPRAPRLGDGFAERRGRGRVVELHQELALADHLAEDDGDLLHDAGLGRLDDLRFRNGNDLAFAARDLVDLGNGGPGDEAGDDKRHQRQDATCEKRRIVVAIGHDACRPPACAASLR